VLSSTTYSVKTRKSFQDRQDLRENQHVLRAGYVALPISVIAQHLKVGDKMIVKGSCWLGRANETLSAPLRLVITRLASGELLALACSGRARHALARYRQRWTNRNHVRQS
jgi:hypothetical protein